MTTLAFTALKSGDQVTFLRGRMKGATGVVAAHVGDGLHVRVTLPSGRGVFARATTIAAKKG